MLLSVRSHSLAQISSRLSHSWNTCPVSIRHSKPLIAPRYLPNESKRLHLKPNRLSKIWPQLMFPTLFFCLMSLWARRTGLFPVRYTYASLSCHQHLSCTPVFFHLPMSKRCWSLSSQLKCRLFYEALLDVIQLEIIFHLSIPRTGPIFLPWDLKQSTFYCSFCINIISSLVGHGP